MIETEEKLKHVRVITTESYHEDLTSREKKLSKSIRTSKATLGLDLVKCTKELLAKTASEVEIVIKTNAAGEPDRIIKTWTVEKETFAR